MSAIKNIKKEIIRNLATVSSINKVYDHEKVNPAGFPAAFVTFQGSDNEFFSNAENKRVFAYRVLILAQIGQDRNNLNAVESAEQVIEDVTGDILDKMDSNLTLGGYTQVIFMEAAVGEPGYVEYEGGYARSAEITLKVHSLYLV
jgi:hypothetical protein